MKMNLTNGQISVLYEGLQAFINTPNLILSVKDKHHMLRNRNVLEPLYKDFIEVKNDLIIEYGELDESQMGYRIVDQDKLNQFVQDITPVADEVIEDIDLYTINVNSIDDKTDIKIIDSLMQIIVEDTE